MKFPVILLGLIVVLSVMGCSQSETGAACCAGSCTPCEDIDLAVTDHSVNIPVTSSTKQADFYVGWWKINPKKTFDAMWEADLLPLTKVFWPDLLQQFVDKSERNDFEFSQDGTLRLHKRTRNLFGRSKVLKTFDLNVTSVDGDTVHFAEKLTTDLPEHEDIEISVHAHAKKVDDNTMVLRIAFKQEQKGFKTKEIFVLERLSGKRGRLPPKKARGKFMGKKSSIKNENGESTPSK